MKGKLLASIIISCLLSLMAHGQVNLSPVHPGEVSVGFVAGFNASGYIFTSDGFGNDLETKERLGVRAGAIVDILLNENLYLQPEGYYIMTGYQWFRPNASPGFVKGYNYRINTVQVPVNFTWKFFHVNQSRVFLSGGPYIGFNFLGNYDIDSATATGYNRYSYAAGIGSDVTDPQINRFDFGFNLAAGYESINGLFLKLFYQRGVLEMAPYNTVTLPHTNTYNYGFTIGYLLAAEQK